MQTIKQRFCLISDTGSGSRANKPLILAIIISWIVAALISTAGCTPVQYNHDLAGKVVDNQTGAPIPGTVILRVWGRSYDTIAGPHGEYYDALETVADENGDFKIPGKGLLIFSNITKGIAYVFKAGYDWVGIDYESLQASAGIVRLQKIDKVMMKDRFPPRPPSDCSDNKIKKFVREIDKARIIVGLTPSSNWNKEND